MFLLCFLRSLCFVCFKEVCLIILACIFKLITVYPLLKSWTLRSPSPNITLSPPPQKLYFCLDPLPLLLVFYIASSFTPVFLTSLVYYFSLHFKYSVWDHIPSLWHSFSKRPLVINFLFECVYFCSHWRLFSLIMEFQVGTFLAH